MTEVWAVNDLVNARYKVNEADAAWILRVRCQISKN